MSKIVADTSVIINGLLSNQIEAGSLRNSQIIIPQAVLDELQSQAANGREQGFTGLEKIQQLRDMSDRYGLDLVLMGTHPSVDDIYLAQNGRIDSLIIDVAKQNDAILYTSDNVQRLVARAENIKTIFLRNVTKNESLEFLKFFSPDTMSIHLKENQFPLAKKGSPGKFILSKLDDKTLTRDYLELIISQILNTTNITNSSNIEISKTGALVIQHDDYRIAVTRPPFSESIEITIVHPIVKLSLDDYEISDKLMKRFSDGAEGIIISGSPGSGKSTLASGLANFYYNRGKIVKTFESPRDLQVDSGITQYSKLDGSFDNAADILLLVRPDYTIFDEVRRREDFGTFADLRLTGVGMIGVIHANSPLDAIQRFIGKIELGIIPNVLDTVVFVKDGKIKKIYNLELKVKVPSGMTESDLARPVIEIRNFEDNILEHEIYTFGEENVIVPITDNKKETGIEKLAKEKILHAFKRYDSHAIVEILSNNRAKVFVNEQYISSIIGRNGSNIINMEKLLNIHITVAAKTNDQSFDIENNQSDNKNTDIPFTFSESKTALLLTVNKNYSSMYVNIHAGNKHVAMMRIDKWGQIKIPKRSTASRNITNYTSSYNDIRLFLNDF